ncbi:hypothetical protein J4409_01075 [Candidatus Woesearchaeota archaeon]|nr:hypothetical protein [Candidatus Woesearchaeota archaeon]
MELKRKIYKRGSSYETTIPQTLLFKLDIDKKKHQIIFKFDNQADKWYIEFEELQHS